ncbi:MAG: hypothetical protein EAX96_00125 [Candidatus Lokiarchaeota archaeon]|nr:hypothetical protein [Candidatus Lokiarchaeota archaeon]
MVRIGVFSDTHLGCTVGNVRPNIYYEIGKIRLSPIEYDFTKSFNEIIDIFCEEKKDLDLIIHAGDLFHYPYKGTNIPLSEAARVIAGRGFKKLNELGIPIVIIDGNHGIFNRRRISTLRQLEVFENVRIFTFWRDLMSCIRNSKSMVFENEEFVVHGFPFADPEFLELLSPNLSEIYNKWINQYELNFLKHTQKINIGLIHGMEIDKSFPRNLNKDAFDVFVAGHDHIFKEKGKLIVPGSTEKWRFDALKIPEDKKNRFFHFVNAEKDKNPVFDPVKISTRNMFVESINVDLNDNHTEILNQIENKLIELKLNEKFDEKTASRIKIFLTGKIGLSTWSKLSPELNLLTQNVLSSKNFNVLQFKIEKNMDYQDERDVSVPGSKKIEYLIENPETEFLEFLKVLEIKDYDTKLLAKLFGEIINDMGEI